MSLLDDFARPCVLLEKTRKPDGEGGYTVEWTDGAQFMNHQALDTSMEYIRQQWRLIRGVNDSAERRI